METETRGAAVKASAKAKELSPEMRELVRFMSLRPDRSVHRHPGGTWSGPGNPKSFMSLFGSSSVAALVKRGVAEYSIWKPGRSGPFPVRATLVDLVMIDCSFENTSPVVVVSKETQP